MTTKFVKIGAAVLGAVLSLTAFASTASAGHRGYYYDAPGFSLHIGGESRHGGHVWQRHRDRGCRPMMAVEKARWTGLRRAHVQRVTPNRVVVAGVRHHGFDRVVFANRRGCPLIHR
ncbi:hypothetical protein M8R20_08745 [Pseudomonas sp. R2.Fl]|nr:hypothetical protein [Pseudomonas sp. R2.Fl]